MGLLLSTHDGSPGLLESNAWISWHKLWQIIANPQQIQCKGRQMIYGSPDRAQSVINLLPPNRDMFKPKIS
jgi:hypothetical protein